MNNNRSVRIFTIPQQPSCCGPAVGQTEEETQSLKSMIEKETSCQVAVSNLFNGGDLTDYPQIVRILNSFGTGALPIIVLDGEVVSMGNPTPEQAVMAIKGKINQT
jgi:hypothetical protein